MLSRVDVGYTEPFQILLVTSVSFETCEGVPVDSLEFHEGNQGYLRV